MNGKDIHYYTMKKWHRFVPDWILFKIIKPDVIFKNCMPKSTSMENHSAETISLNVKFQAYNEVNK